MTIYWSHYMNFFKLAKQTEKLEKSAIAFSAKDLTSLDDRTRLNRRIRNFKEMAQRLGFVRGAIAQNPPEAKKIIDGLIETKVMSSYPQYEEMLQNASKVARDNYTKFSQFCDLILQKVLREIAAMEHVRSEFSNKVYPEIVKRRLKRRLKR